ncbi:chaperone protein dnaJ 11 [Spatholobus suberectus]|nr:chaperone protein dnaJ 11 [Spatholobus suberectus]
MFITSFHTSTTNHHFFRKSFSSPLNHVRLQSIVSFATATEEQLHRPASYLSPYSIASCTTLYDILGIRAIASGEEIKAAYR